MSFELKKILSQKIHQNLKQSSIFNDAKRIAFYYSIGSEVMTKEMVSESMKTKEVSLPKIIDGQLKFKKITDLKKLENGPYDIMEPHDNCETVNEHDLIIVPSIAITRLGDRLGYGHGYYDRYLEKTDSKTLTLAFAQQIIKSIPTTENDIKIDWIVTEDESFQTN